MLTAGNLDDAVATINAALAGKQDASTAATDAELAAAVATINAAIALKQNASTAATDAELALHIGDTTFVHGIADTTLVALTTDSRFPTAGQKAALPGTNGTVSGTNKYVTDSDPRNTNSRAPTSHSHPTSDVTGLDAALTAKQDAATAATDAELASGLAGKSDLGHTHAESEVSGLVSDLAAKQEVSERGQPDGYAQLDSGGKVPTGQIPALALVNVFVVASQAAQLALVAEGGDVAVRSDETKSYVHNGGTAGTMADWTLLQTPSSAVLSVNGQTGVVSLTYTDVGAAPTVHTHTASQVTDFDTQVRTNRLDQMAVPTSALSVNSQRVTNLAAPSSANDAARKVYVDDGLALKQDAATAATDAELAAHEADTTNIHGIADTSVLATASSVASAVAAHEADTSVHGIADTTVLATDAEVATAVADHSADTTSVHGIADTSVLATDSEVATAVSNHEADTTAVHGIANTANLILEGDARLSDARTPSGTAGGVLSGSFPNPGFAVDMATQAELDAVASGVARFASLDKLAVA